MGEAGWSGVAVLFIFVFVVFVAVELSVIMSVLVFHLKNDEEEICIKL